MYRNKKNHNTVMLNHEYTILKEKNVMVISIFERTALISLKFKVKKLQASTL